MRCYARMRVMESNDGALLRSAMYLWLRRQIAGRRRNTVIASSWASLPVDTYMLHYSVL